MAVTQTAPPPPSSIFSKRYSTPAGSSIFGNSRASRVYHRTLESTSLPQNYASASSISDVSPISNTFSNSQTASSTQSTTSYSFSTRNSSSTAVPSTRTFVDPLASRPSFQSSPCPSLGSVSLSPSSSGFATPNPMSRRSLSRSGSRISLPANLHRFSMSDLVGAAGAASRPTFDAGRPSRTTISRPPESKSSIDSSSLFVFDPDGCPIKVTYCRRPITGRVNQKAMAQASPVWKNFFFPPWNSLVTEVDFKEDDGSGLLILLRIVHFQFPLIPHTLSSHQLYDIAVLCDQYDCVHLVQPWLSNWIGESPAIENDKGKWLFISWVFGKEKMFRQLSQMLVREVQCSPDGIITKNKMTLKGPLPLGIQESILSTRLATIDKLLDITEKATTGYEAYHYDLVCRHKNAACDATVYGSLVQGLRALSLFPAPTPATISASVNQIAALISGLKIHVLPTSNNSYGTVGHNQCFQINLKAEVEKVLSSIPSPVLDSHLVHMSIQNKKLSGP